MKKRGIVSVILLVVAVLLFSWKNTQIHGAEHASSYTNAKEFYNSTGDGTGKHIDVVNGTIYFATKGKMANTYAADYRTYYNTVGFDVELTGAGESLVFSVKTGVSLEEVPGSHVVSNEGNGTYSYVLYHITADSLERLAKNADKGKAEKIFSADVIGVRMDSIVVRIYGGMRGDIEEDGKGGLKIYRPNDDYEWVWRIREDAQLRDVESVFGGHYFEEDQNITAQLENFKLDIFYAVDGTLEKSLVSSTHATVNTGAGYRTVNETLNGIKIPYMLGKNNKLYKESNRITNSMTLLLPSTIGMKKTGYHIDNEVKGKEWITADNRTFAAGGTYRPTELFPECGYKDGSICLYANWKPNTYEIIYHANGGEGVMTSTKVCYDEEFVLKENIFSNAGCYFGGWSTTPGGSVVYKDKQSGLKNLTTINEDTIHLYAIWVPEIVTITLDNDGADYAGTEVFYEKYGVGNFEEMECENEMSLITLPIKRGYEFGGYYSGKNVVGAQQYITETGLIVSKETAFRTDTTLYAKWTPRTYQVTLEKEGGIYGSDSVMAIYKKAMPRADAPVRAGYKFKGYYTQKNGKGEQYYDEAMNSKVVYTKTEDMILYAHWVDVLAPSCRLMVSEDTWTKNTVSLTVVAEDYGGGLKSVSIYRIERDGALTCVVTVDGLAGVNRKEVSFLNTMEGVIRYKAVATDMDGNESESYNTVYYDKTLPTGAIIDMEIKDDKFSFDIVVTDGNLGT